jgi:hypothetical protein
MLTTAAHDRASVLATVTPDTSAIPVASTRPHLFSNDTRCQHSNRRDPQRHELAARTGVDPTNNATTPMINTSQRRTTRPRRQWNQRERHPGHAIDRVT